jgi:hypothetical protein
MLAILLYVVRQVLVLVPSFVVQLHESDSALDHAARQPKLSGFPVTPNSISFSARMLSSESRCTALSMPRGERSAERRARNQPAPVPCPP